MNAPFVTGWPDRPPTTRAGEGYDRHAWTVDQLFALTEAGFLEEGAPVELIRGELLAMNAKNNEHEIWKRNLVRFLYAHVGDRAEISVEPTLRLDGVSAPEPDVVVHPFGFRPLDVRGPDVLLLVEVADSSVRRDLVLKAGLYASHGVADYWVLDTVRRRVVVHRRPTPDGYGAVESFGMEASLSLPFAPDAVLRLADLDQL